jgi:glutamyl endopeptidase
MVGADTVITAGHCVHRGSTGSWYNLNDYIIYPGHDGTNANYGSCKAKRLYTTEGWALGSKPEYDYAAIKLNCQVGQATGWLGFAAPTTTKNLPAIISAYPGDKPLGQWVGFDSIMSGAPVWYDAGKRALAFAIHTYRVPNFNRGARINSEVFKNIKTWKNAQ